MIAILILLLFSKGFLVSEALDQVENKHYLALGDSYTIGESVDEKNRFPVQLVKQLKSRGFIFDQPKIIAKTGWTTDELMEGIQRAELRSEYDLVTLLIGVNNQYRGRDIKNYQLEFTQLLEQSIVFAGGNRGRVIVVSIPDYGVTPFGQKKGQARIAKEIDAFNEVSKKICNQYDIAWIDITQISRSALNKRNLVAEDGLHPSGLMYKMWVKEILPVAEEILKQNEK